MEQSGLLFIREEALRKNSKKLAEHWAFNLMVTCSRFITPKMTYTPQ